MSSSKSDDPVAATLSSESPRRRGFSASLWAGVVLLAVGGALLVALPHLIRLDRGGDPVYIADMDDLLYLVWSRDATIYGRPHLVDGVLKPSGPMMHPWLMFVPPALLAHVLGDGPTAIGPVWRVLAGAGCALGLLSALWPLSRGPGLALAVSAFLMFEPGLLLGKPIQQSIEVLLKLTQLGQGEPMPGVPAVLPHLRVVPPGLALPVLLLHFGLVLRARLGGGTRHAIAAGVTFGLLFYLYFYFWTAVLVGAVLAFVLDPPGRRLHATVLAVGGLIGMPAIVSGYLVKSSTPSDWLIRTRKFLPIGRFEDLLIFKGLILKVVLAGVWIFWKRRELIYLWCCALAGLFCMNQQIVSGLELENWHWLQIVGTSFTLLLAAIVLPWLPGPVDPALADPDPAWRRRRRQVLRGALAAALIAQIALGTSLRYVEATRAQETIQWTGNYDDYRREAFSVPAGSVLGGDGEYFFVAAAFEEIYPLAGRLVDFSAWTTDEDLDRRIVLNLFLLGTDREEARDLLGRDGTLPMWWQSYSLPAGPFEERTLARRQRLVDAVWDDPARFLRQAKVGFVILPLRSETGGDNVGNPGEGEHLSGLARRVEVGRRWELWEILSPSSGGSQGL